MELDQGFSTVLRSLRVDDPWVPPRTWESIRSENGAAPPLPSPGQCSGNPSCDVPEISESCLVKLIMNALLGVKPAIVELEQLSAGCCLIPADRAHHQASFLWQRASSTNSIGKILKSFLSSGLLFHFLQMLVNYHLRAAGDAAGGIGNTEGFVRKRTTPPFSLVNQAFAVAVRKVLEGYVCALNTLSASVKLRRGSKASDGITRNSDKGGALKSIICSEVTVLEVYLHTKEQRVCLEALANICLVKAAADADQSTSSVDDLIANTCMEFRNFPRGADLLTYLYVQLRDADEVHYELLKFLFVESCQPYFWFLRSWIYRASIDDVYNELFVTGVRGLWDDDVPVSLNKWAATNSKEQEFVAVPCFLQGIRCPLVRAGQQLQVLIRLLNLCKCNFIGHNLDKAGHAYKYVTNLKDILPFWEDVPSDSFLNPLAFSMKDLEALVYSRESMYAIMFDRLQNFFMGLVGENQRLNYNELPLDGPSMFAPLRNGLEFQYSLDPQENLFPLSMANERGMPNESAAHEDNSASLQSDDDRSIGAVSECSSVCSSDIGTEIIPIETDVVLQHGDSLIPSISYESALDNLIKRPNSSHVLSHGNCERQDSIPDNRCQEDIEMRHIMDSQFCEEAKCAEELETGKEVYSVQLWPFGGLEHNPFHAKVKYGSPRLLNISEHDVMDENGTNTRPTAISHSSEMFASEDHDFAPASWKDHVNGSFRDLFSSCQLSWSSYDPCNFYMNPMLREASICTIHDSRGRHSFSDMLSYRLFDFSSVSDPCIVSFESLVSKHARESQAEVVTLVCSNSSAVIDKSDYLKVQSTRDHVKAVFSSNGSNVLSRDSLPSAYGGADWETSLNYLREDSKRNTEDTKHNSSSVFSVPLDVVIEKCIVQEIRLQYNYISNFTIKLLEDGFNLHEHFNALRRYHFMVLADWADSFILALRKQKWCTVDAGKRVPEIQGLLCSALRRSSCENDPFRERLFVCVKESSMISAPATGVHAFDFLMLGYRLEWPVSIIVTSDALKMYNEIFSSLLQVKLAVFSLMDVWKSLKALLNLTCRHRHIGNSLTKALKSIMEMRQHINHFVCTLEQYVNTHLSEASWCQFQHSLEHQVKDMLDLESVHKRYLDNALKICFLSAESKPVAIIIKNVLQCALDFSLCFSQSGVDSVADMVEPSRLSSHINFSQISAVRVAFHKNLRELHLLYTKSPKHAAFGISRFWSHLDFNGYYSSTISKGIGPRPL